MMRNNAVQYGALPPVVARQQGGTRMLSDSRKWRDTRETHEDIYPDIGRRAVKMNVSESPASISTEQWPHPIEVYTLGRFEVMRDELSVVHVGRAQKKPLEMLKALVAFGGINVPVGHLADTLWPDAEGDLARKAFEMTLSRLRQLLGGEEFIRGRAGQVSIDPLLCRVDSMELEHMIKEAGKCPADECIPLCEKAVRFYRGPFLPSDAGLPWTVPRREVFRSCFLRMIDTVGSHYEEKEQWEKATEYYVSGLEADNLDEELYQRLMVCERELGNRAGAIRTYNRCRRALHEHLGIEPLGETTAIYTSILRER
jgi:LuxR family transcriptional regulator, maltose regulon positive regulatory protein